MAAEVAGCDLTGAQSQHSPRDRIGCDAPASLLSTTSACGDYLHD